jgi:phosphomannomutase/phosphoglucomutase
VDEFGEYIEENQEFALIARIICQMRKGIIVTPVSTSHLVEQIASKHGSDVIYTPVGSIYVARTMLDLIAEGREVIFGGEGNGGLIYPTHQFCRDGGMTAAMMVSVLKSSGIPLSENVKKLPSMSIIKEKIQTRRAKELLKQIEREFSNKKLDKIDGIKISDSGYWALIRPSGTEPFVRIIVESTERETAHAFYRELMKIISPYRE